MNAVLRPYLIGAAALVVLLMAWQGDANVNYSDGVYLSSARLILDGATPYDDFLAAHPPLLYYAGAALVGVTESLDGVRAFLAVVSLVTGGLVAVAVWRMTAVRAAAVLAGLAAMVTPWTLHEHAVLVPENLGAPLLMGAALLAARERTVVWGGVLAATAVGVKWPFVLPGALLVLATPARARYAITFAATLALGIVGSFLLFGGDLDDQVLNAHGEVGWRDLHTIAGLGAQAVWNLGPLVALAAAAFVLRDRARDRPQLVALAAVAVGALVHVLTITKTGVAVSVSVLAEPPLVALGAAGLVWLSRPWLVAGLAAAALCAVQSAAFALDPQHPGLFVRPFAAAGYAWEASDDEVAQTVEAARACSPDVAYSGVPFYAFLADRRLPGKEPDGFLLANTQVGKAVAPKVAADQPVCP